MLTELTCLYVTSGIDKDSAVSLTRLNSAFMLNSLVVESGRPCSPQAKAQSSCGGLSADVQGVHHHLLSD